MAIALGETFRLLVETTTPGTFIEVGGMDEWSNDNSQTIDTFPTFGAATPLGIPSPPDITFSISGFFDPVDAGQVRLRTIAVARTTVNIQVLWDGTNGYTQEVRVGSRSHGASASGGPQTTSFEFAPSDDPVIEGSGPLP
jgi:hypothetical protein